MGVRVRFGVVVAAFVLLLVAVPAHAAYPGQNGKIVFTSARNGGGNAKEIYSINPDGSEVTRLTDSEGDNHLPRWSPDGLRIIFGSSRDPAGTYLMNADGSGQTLVTLPADAVWSPDGTKIAFTQSSLGGGILTVANSDGTGEQELTTGASTNPAWSPDGSLIAFEKALNFPDGLHVATINVDGTNETIITPGRFPDWSPDGTKIAFTLLDPNSEIYVMNSDGTDQTNLTNDPNSEDQLPAWSPDGTKIAFARLASPGRYISVMDSDGSGRVDLTGPFTGDNLPEWQPVIIGGYPRPKAATPLYASLVPAHRVCQSPNRVHAAPLSYGSCNPPTFASGTLTAGTPDANGQPANFTGSARYRVISGDPGTPLDEADVAIDVALADVRCAATSPACPDGALSDYTGRLLLINPPLQLTDKDGQPATNGQGAATGQTNFPVPFDCTPTVSTTIGSSCAISTTADAVLPNVIKEGHRAIWESGPVHVRDAGPNGTGFGAGCPPACGDGDETLFLRQGIFIP
jgi:WD40-like Beta Propeller Repeat